MWPWVLLPGLVLAGAPTGKRSVEQELQDLWTALGTSDPVKANEAITALAARPRQTVPWLGKRLAPVPRVEPRQIARWIADLDSERFRARRQAVKELEKLAEQAEPAMRKTLAGRHSPEVGHTLKIILNKLRNDRLQPPPDRLRAWRAIEVLEQIGDKKARKLLANLAGGAPEALLTVEAQGAIERLGQTNAVDR